MDGSPPGFSVPGILQARMLKWVAMPSSRRSFQPRNPTSISYVSCIAGRFFTAEPPGRQCSWYYCAFQDTVLYDWKCLLLCFLFMCYLHETDYKPITVQYYIADSVSWVPKLTLLDLWTNWTYGRSLVCRGLTVPKNHQFPNDPLKPLKAAPQSTSMCRLPENTAQPCAHRGRGRTGVFVSGFAWQLLQHLSHSCWSSKPL